MESTSPLKTCELHKTHSPANMTLELHHVIPVAWQLAWQPAVAPYPGKDPDGRGELWDARLVPACPTGHRNVHAWIVRMMHMIDALVKAGGVADAEKAFKLVHASARDKQANWALEGLLRFHAAGGSLQQLVAAGEWGEA
jgi:hypothetical protein